MEKNVYNEIYDLIEPFGLRLGTDINSNNLDAELLEIQNQLFSDNQKSILQKQKKSLMKNCYAIYLRC